MLTYIINLYQQWDIMISKIRGLGVYMIGLKKYGGSVIASLRKLRSKRWSSHLNVVGVTPKATRHKGEQTEGTRRLSFFNKRLNILEE